MALRRITIAVALALVMGLFPGTGEASPPATLSKVPAGHDQAVTVSVSSYASTTAVLEAWQRGAGGWRRALGPWTARVGRNGVARAGAKREGDGRTPSGVYALPFAFGVRANPGTALPWRAVTRSIVWDDDSASRRYNLWTDLRYASAGRDPERLFITPTYDEAAAVAYNTERRPGLGSAIFLHVTYGKATSGCVVLPAAQLTSLLRWLRPATHPVISIGTA